MRVYVCSGVRVCVCVRQGVRRRTSVPRGAMGNDVASSKLGISVTL